MVRPAFNLEGIAKVFEGKIDSLARRYMVSHRPVTEVFFPLEEFQEAYDMYSEKIEDYLKGIFSPANGWVDIKFECKEKGVLYVTLTAEGVISAKT